MNVQREIHRLENILKRGYTERNQMLGIGSAYTVDRGNLYSLKRNKERVKLTPGRRKMIEQELKALRSQGTYLFLSKLADSTILGRRTGITAKRGRHIIHLTEKSVVVPGQVFQGTYSHAKHGPLKK